MTNEIYEYYVFRFGSCVGLMWKRWIGIIILEMGFSLPLPRFAIATVFPSRSFLQQQPKPRGLLRVLDVGRVSISQTHISHTHTHNSQQCRARSYRSKCATHFNLATICNLYDNVHFDVELAVNTCKTITATISKCGSQRAHMRFPLTLSPLSFPLGSLASRRRRYATATVQAR